MLNFEEKQSNYEGFLSMEEIDKLLFELKEEHVSLLNKSPSMIKGNHDIKSRQKEQIKFDWLNDLYIAPLLEFAKRVSLAEGRAFTDSYTYSDYSIMERTVRLRNFLVSKGYQPETITSLVPKTVEEINMLLQAAKLGFSLKFDGVPDLTNENRLDRAKNYLLLKNVIPADTKEVENSGKTR